MLEALQRHMLGPTLPLVGRVASEASRVGVVVSGRISRTNSDPHPTPSPQGGGERTEFAACADSPSEHALTEACLDGKTSAALEDIYPVVI